MYYLGNVVFMHPSEAELNEKSLRGDEGKRQLMFNEDTRSVFQRALKAHAHQHTQRLKLIRPAWVFKDARILKPNARIAQLTVQTTTDDISMLRRTNSLEHICRFHGHGLFKASYSHHRGSSVTMCHCHYVLRTTYCVLCTTY